MPISHLLEDFSAQANTDAVHLLADEALEELRLEAFERGYGAGWEDAAATQEKNRAVFTEELSKSIADASFTYHEALARMSRSLEPMFQSLINAVLPETLERGLVRRISDQLCDMAREQVAQPVSLCVPIGFADEIRPLLAHDLPMPVTVTEDEALSLGQARLQVGMAEREVDCSALLASIGQAFDAYIFEAKKALANE